MTDTTRRTVTGAGNRVASHHPGGSRAGPGGCPRGPCGAEGRPLQHPGLEDIVHLQAVRRVHQNGAGAAAGDPLLACKHQHYLLNNV